MSLCGAYLYLDGRSVIEILQITIKLHFNAVFFGNTYKSYEGRKDELQRWKQNPVKMRGDTGYERDETRRHKINDTLDFQRAFPPALL